MPLSIRNSFPAEPLTRTETRVVDMMPRIQSRHLGPKPICLMISSKYPQFKVSNAFSKSALNMRTLFFVLLAQDMVSLRMRVMKETEEYQQKDSEQRWNTHILPRRKENEEADDKDYHTEKKMKKLAIKMSSTYSQHSPLDDIISNQSSTMEYCLIKNLAKENPVGKNSSEGKKSAVYS
ncbi:hypothetical protein LXL04_018694 [Taraxacum kok-saghyz]